MSAVLDPETRSTISPDALRSLDEPSVPPSVREMGPSNTNGHGDADAHPDEGRHAVAEVDGVDLHWVEYGDASDRAPVLFLHGLNDSHLTWRRVASALAVDRRVLALDLPGHGLSGRPDASYKLDWYAGIVAKWIHTMGLEPVDIVGHSLGGGVAQALLLEKSVTIRRLVLAASGGLGKDVAFVLRLASLPSVVELFGQPFMAMGTSLALRPWRAVLPLEHIEELSAMNGREGSARAFSRTVRDVIDWRGQKKSFFTRASEIGELPPITVLWGDCDPIIPIAHGRAFARAVDGVRFEELTGCGHYLHHDAPEAFLRSVRDALDAPSWPEMHLRSG
jgi:pimeloyl-ACP methyl ester carboxylesterase